MNIAIVAVVVAALSSHYRYHKSVVLTNTQTNFAKQNLLMYIHTQTQTQTRTPTNCLCWAGARRSLGKVKNFLKGAKKRAN